MSKEPKVEVVKDEKDFKELADYYANKTLILEAENKKLVSKCTNLTALYNAKGQETNALTEMLNQQADEIVKLQSAESE